jgi:hypothetical protein
MGIATSELTLILIILFVVGYGWTVPIVGIVRAVRRRRRGERSGGAIVWSAINVGLFGLAATATLVRGMLPLGPGVCLALNGVWLYLALLVNRAAAGARAANEP